MKKLVTFFFLGIVILSCNQTITNKDLNKINGYWEIKQVILKNGENKDYTINETIDYFQIKGTKGFRQKVMPQLDGTYKTNHLKETISISNDNGDFYMNYATKYGKWEEEIIEIQDSTLVLKNIDGIEYNYKKYKPFSLK